MKKILGLIPTTLFFLGMACISIPDLWLRRFLNFARHVLSFLLSWWVTSPTVKQRRMTETAWQFRWARFYRRLIHRLMGISMPITILGNVPIGKLCILVANHRTAIDHLCMAEVIKRLGLDHVLWVVKDEMRSVLVVGGSCERAGYALVSRQGDTADKEAVRAMARLARQDGASVALYPEGKRHNGIPQENGRWANLRDPKRGGFQVLLDELPDHDVVFVCLDWRGLRGGKTIWDGDGLLGLRGKVTVWHRPLVPGDTAESILEEGWSCMDEMLH